VFSLPCSLAVRRPVPFIAATARARTIPAARAPVLPSHPVRTTSGGSATRSAPGAHRFGGEERLEDPLLDLRRHSRAGVTDLHGCLVPVQPGPHGQTAACPIAATALSIRLVHLVQLGRISRDRGQRPCWDRSQARTSRLPEVQAQLIPQHIWVLIWCPDLDVARRQGYGQVQVR
jgi:hypothetical protein